MSVWRVRDRSTFDALAALGTRGRSGPLTVVHLGDDERAPRVAYAVPRSLGSAVARNRLRRRLRAVCRELDARGELPPGAYLVSARPAAASLPFDELRRAVRAAVAEVRR